MSEMSAAEAAVVARFDAAEPAPESWRGDDGLRSAIAREYAEFQSAPSAPEQWELDNGDDFAAGLLALPEVAALRAKAAAADRVRGLIAEHQAAHVNTVWLDRLRRALDGDGPC